MGELWNNREDYAMFVKGKEGRSLPKQEDRDKESAFIKNNLPEGTPEEIKESFDKASDYLYKVLDFSENEERSLEEVKKARRDFFFLKHGPKASFLSEDKRQKLTSMDVFFILTTKVASYKLGEVYNISPKEICAIRRGAAPAWRWEYDLVRRLSAIVRDKILRYDSSLRSVDIKNKNYSRKKLYRCYKVLSPTEKEELFIITAPSKARSLRKDLIPVREYERLERRNELDIYYPIEVIDLLC